MKNKKDTPEKMLKYILEKLEGMKGCYTTHTGPHYVGEREPAWSVSCRYYDEALESVEHLLLTELAKCGKM